MKSKLITARRAIIIALFFSPLLHAAEVKMETAVMLINPTNSGKVDNVSHSAPVMLHSEVMDLTGTLQPLTHQHQHQQPQRITSVSAKDEKQMTQDLVWSARGGKFSVTNTSLEEFRLKPVIRLMPDNLTVILDKSVIQPGETLVIKGACPHHLPKQTAVVIVPVSRDGKTDAEQRVSLQH